MLEDEDGPLVERQPAEGLIDPVVLDIGARVIGRRPIGEPDQGDLGPAGDPTRLIEAGIDGQP